MEVKTLKQRPDQLDNCIALIEKSFEYSPQHSYKEDFNLLIDETNYENCYFLESDQQVIATVFCLPRVLSYKDITTPVLFIGGISVGQSQQGQGVFRTLFETVIQLNSNYSFYFLWSDLSSLYEKFNFYEFGSILEEGPDQLNSQSSHSNSHYTSLTANDYEFIQDAYEKYSQEYILPQRSSHDWTLLRNNNSIGQYKDQGHYLFINKGMDLQNIIHESYPLKLQESYPHITWTYHDTEKISRYMGFARIGNSDLLSEFIAKISNDEIIIKTVDQEHITIMFQNSPYTMSHRDFLQGLWGPGRVEEWKNIPQIIIFGFDSI